MPGYKQRLFHSLRGPYRRLQKPYIILCDRRPSAVQRILVKRMDTHRKMCVPSSLNQCIILWHNNYVKVFPADPRPFEYEAKAAEVYADAYYYSNQVFRSDRPIAAIEAPSKTPVDRASTTQVCDARLVWRWSAERPVK